MIPRFTTPEEIEEQRTRARDGDAWFENGKLNWKGRPNEWALLLKQALEEKETLQGERNEAARRATLLAAERNELEEKLAAVMAENERLWALAHPDGTTLDWRMLARTQAAVLGDLKVKNVALKARIAELEGNAAGLPATKAESVER